eukprot:9209344-Pyramimonas_sp.AAC.1
MISEAETEVIVSRVLRAANFMLRGRPSRQGDRSGTCSGFEEEGRDAALADWTWLTRSKP